MRSRAAFAALCLAIVPTLAQAQEPTPSTAATASAAAAEQTGIFGEPSIIGRGLRYFNGLVTSGDGGDVKARRIGRPSTCSLNASTLRFS